MPSSIAVANPTTPAPITTTLATVPPRESRGGVLRRRQSRRMHNTGPVRRSPSASIRAIVPAETLTECLCETDQKVRIGLHQVEVAGIEPASFGGSSRLLRAQPAVVFSAPAVAQAPCRGLSHCLVSLPAP